jgi:hypothetical protein
MVKMERESQEVVMKNDKWYKHLRQQTSKFADVCGGDNRRKERVGF